jgi:hypothetical protein
MALDSGIHAGMTNFLALTEASCYVHRTSKFGTFTPSPAGEGWGEEILKTEFLSTNSISKNNLINI